MADHTFTRCPGCGTVFRVTAEQLKLREGQVRCGHCRAVFDANDHIIALDAGRSDDVGVPDELAAGLPTITLRSAEALQPVDDPRAQPDSAAAQAISANAATDDALAVSSAASEGENENGIESETAESQTAGSETPESETPESETPESETP
ncbi:MAG: zinc-ribbon domain-containing protein, partial [Pseudomonadota bacterium]|nr:zinc-ribbon domain-containing protein [Pseudomonadota bacterium]